MNEKNQLCFCDFLLDVEELNISKNFRQVMKKKKRETIPC